MNPEEKKEEMPDALVLADALLEAGFSDGRAEGQLEDGRQFSVIPAEGDGPEVLNIDPDNPVESCVTLAVRFLHELKA